MKKIFIPEEYKNLKEVVPFFWKLCGYCMAYYRREPMWKMNRGYYIPISSRYCVDSYYICKHCFPSRKKIELEIAIKDKVCEKYYNKYLKELNEID